MIEHSKSKLNQHKSAKRWVILHFVFRLSNSPCPSKIFDEGPQIEEEGYKHPSKWDCGEIEAAQCEGEMALRPRHTSSYVASICDDSENRAPYTALLSNCRKRGRGLTGALGCPPSSKARGHVHVTSE